MPFKVATAPKCPKCDRSVYAAEEKMAGGFKYHKVCFKCAMCNKLLDSTNCAEHEKTLYCKVCHGRRYGPKGVGFGQGAGALCMDTGEQFGNEQHASNGNSDHANGNGTAMKHSDSDKIQAPEGQGCPKCGGYVYHADQIPSKGSVYHKECFKCFLCHRVLDSRIANDGPDSKIYCNGCYRKKFSLKGYGYGQGGPALMTADVGENGTHIPKSIDTSVIPAAPGEGCPRCGGEVFHAEKMLSKKSVYHKKCFKCNNCKRPLDSVLCNDAPDGEIYCKGCYSKIFGTKGYGVRGFVLCTDGEGDGTFDRPLMSSDPASIPGRDGAKDTCPRCGGQVFHAEKMLSKNNVFHKQCFTCVECRRPLDSTSCCDSPDGEIYCRGCYGKIFGPKGYGYGGSGSMPALMAPSGPAAAQINMDERIQVDFLPPLRESTPKFEDGCPRCGHAVYEAEKLVAAKKSWHKRCFVCGECSRHLDSTTVNDGPDSNIYCKGCYSAKFGIRGYGFGGGAGTLSTEGVYPERVAAEGAYILP